MKLNFKISDDRHFFYSEVRKIIGCKKFEENKQKIEKVLNEIFFISMLKRGNSIESIFNYLKIF